MSKTKIQIAKIANNSAEYIILWKLYNSDNLYGKDHCEWSNFTDDSDDNLEIPASTLSQNLDKLIGKGFIIKPERNYYKITQEGIERYKELTQYGREGPKGLNYPPQVILKRREYNHWILWMLYNNEACKWSDFLEDIRFEEILYKINQSSLSRALNYLMDNGFVINENREYKITPLGKSEYFNVLREYELDRQSILEEESKHIQEFTKFSTQFFEEYGIEDDRIKFRFLNNVLKLNYSRVETLLEEEEDFNKILLFLSINHPNQYPDYISPERFSSDFNLKKTTLNFFIDKIVEEEFYEIKFFKLEVSPNKVYYFQVNEKIERVLRAIVDDYITRYTYLNNLYENTNKKAPALTISNIIENILSEICNHLFHDNLKDTLRKFLPNYIKYLAYKIETEKKLITDETKLESLIWQTISAEFETFSSKDSNTLDKEPELNYTLYYQIFESMDLFYLSKLNYIEYIETIEGFKASNREFVSQIIQMLKNGKINEAFNLFNDKGQNLDKIESLVVNDIIKTVGYRFEESIEITNHIIQEFPQNYIGYLLQSMTYFLMDFLDKSLKVVEEGIQNAFNISLIAQKAQILIKKDQELEGLKVINKAISEFPNNILLLRTKFLAIVCTEGVCTRSPKEPLEVINNAIKLKPLDKELLILKALILCITKKYREAEKIIKEELNFVIDPWGLNPLIDTSTILILVYSYIARNRFKEALDFANISQIKYQDYSISYLSKALVFGYSLIYSGELNDLTIDDFKESINNALNIEKINFKKALYLQSEAFILRDLGLNEEALNAIEEAIKLNPTDFDFYKTKVLLMMSLGKDKEAIGISQSITNKFPEQRYCIGKLESLIYYKLQDYNKGLNHIDEILKQFPDNKELLNNRAYMLLRLNRMNEAFEAAETLISCDPEDGNSYDTYAELLIESGKYEEALEKLREAERINPTAWYISDTYRKMSICHEKLGNMEEAKKSIKKMEKMSEIMSSFHKDLYDKKSED